MSTLETDPGDIESRLALARASCAQHGVRFTPLRTMVLRLLLQQQRFLTAYELAARVREMHRTAQPMTIYRILDFLIDQGLAHRLDTVNGYVACQDVLRCGHGVFAICTRCGKVSEIGNEVIGDVLQEQVTRAGFTLDRDGIEIKVVCNDCP